MSSPTALQNLVPKDPNAAVTQIDAAGSGIDALTKLGSGNPHLVTNPGLLQALVSGNATAAQAASVNSFMAGLQLQTQVEHARATGTQVQFTNEEQGILNNLHVKYDDVYQTPAMLLQKQQAQAAASGLTLATDQNGQIIYGADGTPVIAQKPTQAKKKSGGGFWHAVGGVFHELGKPFNVVSQTLGDAITGSAKVAGDFGLAGDLLDPLKAAHDIGSLATGNIHNIDTSVNLGNVGNDLNAVSGDSAEQDQAMRDAGYDPSNPLSIVAYRAAGKDFQDTTGLAKNWESSHAGAGQDGAPSGADMVALAKRYINNPGDVTTGIETDPNLPVDQKAAQLQQLSGVDFQDLVKRVGGARAGIGNSVVSSIGVDPVKHATFYNDTATAVDLAASFAVDPVLVLGKATKAAKLAQVGLKGFQDSAFAGRISDILLGDARFGARANVQRGMNRFLDNVNTIREASVGEQGAESAQKLAAAYADVRATTPGLEPLIGDFTGNTRVLMGEAGRPLVDSAGKTLIGKGAPVTNIQEAADYLGSKLAYARLMSGRAAVEWNLMPGSLSAFGTRALLKAPLAKVVGRNAGLSVKTAEDAMKILPWTNDAVDESSHVVAAQGDLTAAQRALDAATAAHKDVLAAEAAGTDTTAADRAFGTALKSHDTATRLMDAQQQVDEATAGLASARRAATAEVMYGPQMSGEIRANLLKRGTLSGTGFNPGNYMAAQAERSVRRLSSMMPRNMNINLEDASSTDKIYKFLQLYTSRADAALGAAKWAAADEGTRRTMIVGIQQQVMHSAGYGASEAGRLELDRVAQLADHPFSAVDDTEEGHRYAVNGEDIADEPRLGGKPVHYGVLPGHVQTDWTLPSYGQLAQHAAQSALWRRTFGPMFQSKIADLMTFGFKTFQLMKPSTWTRNMVEGLGNAAFRGELGDVLRAKAAAIEAGVMPDRGASRVLNPKNWSKVADKAPTTALRFAPLAMVGRAYRHVALRAAGMEDGLEYISRLSKPELEQYMRDYSQQHLRADLDPGGLLQARGILNEGLTPSELRLNEQHALSPFQAGKPSFDRVGYSVESTNGITGADRWAGNLGTLVNQFPEHAKALIAAAKAGDGDVSKIVELIKSDPRLGAKMDSLRLRSLYQDDRLGTTFEARTAEERDLALEQLARKQVSVASGMVTGRDGEHLDAVSNYIYEHNRAPDASWLMDHVPNEQRPFEVLAPKYIARPPEGGIDGFAHALSNVTDKWYLKLVEQPIQHTTSLPVFLANYGKARYFLSDAEDRLAEQIAAGRKAALGEGASADVHAEIDAQAKITADHLMKQQAVKMSWVRTEQIIDDPGLKTQLDVTGRNFFMYSRATQAMIRRWGQAIIQDPFRLQKAALLLHAAEHSGMIYTDKNGELSFIYPGSAPIINAITKLGSVIPGFGNMAQLPLTPDLTGKVLFAAPGLDNPLKMGLSPIVNIPYRVIEAHMPAAAQIHMNDFDKFVNGPIGAGQIGSLFMPAAIRNEMSNLTTNDRKSQWASAMVGAIANLDAAGLSPGPNASPTEVDAYLARMKTQVHNILHVRAALGLFFPAPASLPTMGTSGSKADAEFAAQGLKSLRDEYQKMLNDFGGDYNQANALWAALHPDKLVYETAASKSLAKGAVIPADDATFKWMTRNAAFMTKYRAASAYFLPASNGQFSNAAYQEEIALGLRQKYTPTEFYDQVRVNQGGATYWPSYDAYKQREAVLKESGDSAGLTQLRDNWAQYSAQFKSTNPLFTNSLDASSATRGNAAADALRNLKDMIANPKGLPSTVNVAALSRMVSAYEEYEQWRVQNRGGGAQGTATRNAVTGDYQAYMTGLAASDPALMHLYNGVFRPLSPELVDLAVNNGG